MTDQNNPNATQPAGQPVAQQPAANPAPAPAAGAPAPAQGAQPAPAPTQTAPAGTTAPAANPGGAPAQPAPGLLQTTAPATDGKPVEGEKKPEENPVIGAPENYDIKPIEAFKDTKPEDAPMLNKFLSTAKELNLSNAAAQKLYDAMAPMLADQPKEAVAYLRRTGSEATKADAEIGGANFDANLKVAMKGYNDARFATPALRSLLQQSGLDSHPEVVRLFYRIGKLTGEGQFFRDRGAAPAGNDYRRRYPNTPNLNP